MEVRGYADAANWVYSQANEPRERSSGELPSLSDVRHVHRLALTPAWDVAPHRHDSPAERPGSLRKHDVEPRPGGMTPPPWPRVPLLIAEWLEGVHGLSRVSGNAEPEALARVHSLFERIHPFSDGNGRAGRLVLNLLLVRLGYPPAIIYKTDRARYLGALRRADQGDDGPLGELIARAILDSLHRFVVPSVAGSSRLVALPDLASERVSANALRVAATRGRLRASKGADGAWRSTRAWVEEYVASRYARDADGPR